MPADHDQMSLWLTLSRLERDYPGWCFAVRHGYGGPRVEAYRPHADSGLYAVITDDPAELRRELDHAA